MPSRISTLCDLLLLTLLLPTVSESDDTVVKVKNKDTAVLPYSGRCSGVACWTLYRDSSDILAQCNKTECRSVKEGYQMIYNQYLQGDFSLIIPDADFSKRGVYVCDCDGSDLGDVQLHIETLNSTIQKKVGDTLLLDLYLSDRVEMIYNSTDTVKSSSKHICTVDRHSVNVSREYSARASVSSTFTLREVQESDSGVYTVRDSVNKEIICIYTVTVNGKSETDKQKQNPSDPSPGQGAALPGWAVGVMLVLGIICVVSVVLNVLQWIKPQRLQRELMWNGKDNNIMQINEENPLSSKQEPPE